MKRNQRSPVARCLALVAASLSVLLESGARADQPPSSADVVRVEALVHAAAVHAHEQRIGIAVTGLVAGATLIPVGIVLSERSNVVGQSIGVGALAGGGATLAVSELSLFRSGAERLEDSFEQRRATTADPARLIADFEIEWNEAARAAHTRRIAVGLTELLLGAGCTGAGMVLLFTGPVDGTGKSRQYNAGSLLVGPGVPFMSIAIRGLMQDSPEESSWATYQAMSGGGATPARSATLTGVSVLPMPGGAFAGMTMSF